MDPFRTIIVQIDSQAMVCPARALLIFNIPCVAGAILQTDSSLFPNFDVYTTGLLRVNRCHLCRLEVYIHGIPPLLPYPPFFCYTNLWIQSVEGLLLGGLTPPIFVYICATICTPSEIQSDLVNIFKASALWANAFYMSICPQVCVCLCLSVCSLFEVPFKRLFAPHSMSDVQSFQRFRILGEK